MFLQRQNHGLENWATMNVLNEYYFCSVNGVEDSAID
jgi:hypothetical protein